MIGASVSVPMQAALGRHFSGFLDLLGRQWRFDLPASGAHPLTCGF